jgi:hypothetical protein
MRSASMQPLNEQQRSFATFYVSDPDAAGNGTASAIAAGYAPDCAKQTAYRLLRHDGVHAEVDRLTREALGDHATAALGLLGRAVRDEQAPLKVRVDACKTILDRAGFIPPKAADAPRPPSKPTERLSLAELDVMMVELRAEIAAKAAALEAELIDVTPLMIEGEEAAG